VASPTTGFIEKVWKTLLLVVDARVIQLAPELGHLAPIIFTFGTAFFALISCNYPLAVFAGSGAEAAVLYTLFTLVGEVLSFPKEAGKTCSSTFETLTPARFAMSLRGKAFPNAALYFISFAASYLIQSMSYFSDELTAMGPQYSSRPYIALLGSAMLILLYAAYLLAYGCESVASVGISILLGIFIGYLISSQNMLLLGKPSISVLFVPPLVKRENMDFLCVKA
jgi:hypothetical protein